MPPHRGISLDTCSFWMSPVPCCCKDKKFIPFHTRLLYSGEYGKSWPSAPFSLQQTHVNVFTSVSADDLLERFVHTERLRLRKWWRKLYSVLCTIEIAEDAMSNLLSLSVHCEQSLRAGSHRPKVNRNANIFQILIPIACEVRRM